MTDAEIAAAILELSGGPENVTDVDMCFTRLRLVLVDPGKVDEAAIDAMPDVVMAFTQSGQYQVVLGARVRGVFRAFRALWDGRTAG